MIPASAIGLAQGPLLSRLHKIQIVRHDERGPSLCALLQERVFISPAPSSFGHELKSCHENGSNFYRYQAFLHQGVSFLFFALLQQTVFHPSLISLHTFRCHISSTFT